ncbi:hypothetical protein DVA80_21055, partial [Acinetobacter baumannii]
QINAEPEQQKKTQTLADIAQPANQHQPTPQTNKKQPQHHQTTKNPKTTQQQTQPPKTPTPKTQPKTNKPQQTQNQKQKHHHP